MNRILLAAPKSGSGKTLITCGIIKAFMNKNMKVRAFKCGPDYIDPMFHEKIIGAKTGNLDTYFCDDNTVKYIFAEGAKNSDISVIEGVMGYYDGIGGVEDKASTYDVARATKTPVILIVDCKGTSLSVVPLIKGFLEFKKESHIAGVILNKISYMLFGQIKKIIEETLNIKVFGYVPEIKEFVLESRHLGLIMPREIKDLQGEIDAIAKRFVETIDFDAIIALSKIAPKLNYTTPVIPKLKKSVRIAVAMDNVFCFYYRENLELLSKMGAEIVPFSPLKDRKMPDNIDGVIFGGGYPELFSRELSENKQMLKSVRELLSQQISIFAECGGFMYLSEQMESARGVNYNMAGIIKGHCYKTEQLSRFGYAEIMINKPSVFGEAGTTFKGHEFHYWDSTNNGEEALAVKPVSGRSWECSHADEHIFAGFPHLYFYSNIGAVYNFLKKCGEKNDHN